MNVGALRVPVQARLKSDGTFEWMAGPAAVPVPHELEQAKPAGPAVIVGPKGEPTQPAPR